MTNALITAATKGMGRATAKALAKEGISLAICARNQQDLDAFKLELLEMNPYIQVMTQTVDGSVKEQLVDFAENAEKELGFIGIIINNLGMFDPVSIQDESDEAFDKQFNTNLMPAYHLFLFFGLLLFAFRFGFFFSFCFVV